jgi:response regulator RpfG family c-di-GMP phosphodiesterase
MWDTDKAAGRRILVVEDEFLIAQMVGDMLADLDCTCIGPIMTLEAGIVAAASVQCDAAIINLVIQGQKAYAVVEELAARNIPFCFASGVSPDSVHEKWRQHRFIRKPFLIEEVRTFLDEVLGGKPDVADVTLPGV